MCHKLKKLDSVLPLKNICSTKKRTCIIVIKLRFNFRKNGLEWKFLFNENIKLKKNNYNFFEENSKL